MEKVFYSFEAAVTDLKKISNNADFPDQSKELQSQIRSHNDLSRNEKDRLLAAIQALWDERRRHKENTKEESYNSKLSYFRELDALDYSYDGAFMLQGFSNWESVGDKVKAARQEIKEIQARLKNDKSLVKADRESVRRKIDHIWFKIKDSEETTFVVHRDRANDLYNEAYAAVRDMSLREASEILKANQAEIKTLYLKFSDKDKFRDWFNELWSTLKARRSQEHDNWLERQNARLSKLYEVRDRLQGRLEKVRQNISDNQDRYYSAKSSDFQNTIQSWINEGEEQERDMERRIDDIDATISEIKSRLDR